MKNERKDVWEMTIAELVAWKKGLVYAGYCTYTDSNGNVYSSEDVRMANKIMAEEFVKIFTN